MKFEIKLTKRRVIILSKSFSFIFKWCYSHRFQFDRSGMWPRNIHLTNVPGDSALEYFIQLHPIGSIFFLIFSLIFTFLFLSLCLLSHSLVSFLSLFLILFLFFSRYGQGWGRWLEGHEENKRKKILPISSAQAMFTSNTRSHCVPCAPLLMVQRPCYLIFYHCG